MDDPCASADRFVASAIGLAAWGFNATADLDLAADFAGRRDREVRATR